jgi:hypothetical protein
MSKIINAGLLLKEFATDPRTRGADGVTRLLGAPVLCEQHVACGPTPSVSQALTQDTRCVEVTVGLSAPDGLYPESAIYHHIGTDSLAELIEMWKGGTLPTSTIPAQNGARAYLDVGGGACIAFLGASLTPHLDDAMRSAGRAPHLSTEQRS